MNLNEALTVFVCVQWVPGAGAAPAHNPGPGDREADGAAEGVAVEGAGEAPTAAPHAGEGEAADAPARGKDAAPPTGTCRQTRCALQPRILQQSSSKKQFCAFAAFSLCPHRLTPPGLYIDMFIISLNHSLILSYNCFQAFQKLKETAHDCQAVQLKKLRETCEK